MIPKQIPPFVLCCKCLDFDPVWEFFITSWHTLANVSFDRTILVLFSTVLAGFISITVPVALSIVSKHTEEYKDKEISESFLRERSYQFQVYVLPVLVVLALIAFGSKVEKGWLVYLILAVDVTAFVIFIIFLHVFGQYATNFDTFHSDKLKRDSDEIVQKGN